MYLIWLMMCTRGLCDCKARKARAPWAGHLIVIHARGSFIYFFIKDLLGFFFIPWNYSPTLSVCVIGKVQISFLLCSVTGREILWIKARPEFPALIRTLEWKSPRAQRGFKTRTALRAAHHSPRRRRAHSTHTHTPLHLQSKQKPWISIRGITDWTIRTKWTRKTLSTRTIAWTAAWTR